MAENKIITFGMLEDDDPKLWAAFDRQMRKDDDSAAEEHLKAGYPIFYAEPRNPDELIRQWPDGRREIVALDENDEIVVVRQL